MSRNDFWCFSRKESLGVLFVLVIILLTLNLNFLISRKNNSPLIIAENDSLIASFDRMHSNMQERKIESSQFNDSGKVDKRNVTSPQKESDQQRKSNEDKYGYPRQEKLKDSEFISLNQNDTTEWKKVPGIGSSYAARIIKYRDKLGGFTSIDQLKEVYGIDEDLFNKISSYIREESNSAHICVKLQINKLEFKEILAHPYIDYEQTKAIVNLRKRIGKISSIEELAMLDEFTFDDIIRIRPYLEF